MAYIICILGGAIFGAAVGYFIGALAAMSSIMSFMESEELHDKGN